MLDLEPIKARLAAATPGPWSSCGDKCKCRHVMSNDFPIAEVTKGDWGDDYPSVRLVGDSSLDLRAEPYMAQITYGNVPAEQFLANRAFISSAPSDVAALLAEVERLRANGQAGE